jgi:hypothetical protein
MYAPALAAFIEAKIGSFLGAYFKEYLLDHFNKNRRKREIRIELVKNLSKFYGLMKRYAINKNMHEFEVCKLDHIQSETATLNWDDKNAVADYQRRVAGQFENAKLLAGKHEADTNELTELRQISKPILLKHRIISPFTFSNNLTKQ